MHTLVIAVLTTACAPAESEPKKATDYATTQSVRAAVGPCMITPEPAKPKNLGGAVLADAVVGAAIKEGLNVIGNALEEAGKENVTKVVVSANVDNASSLADPKCLQIVRGQFDQLPVGSTVPVWAPGIGLSPAQYAQLSGNRLGTLQQPEFIFEAYFRRSGNSNTFALSPTLVAFFHPIEQRLLRFGRERDIAVEVVFHEPNKKFDDASNPSTRIHIGEMASPALYFFQRPLADRATPGESPWFSVPESGPFTVTAAVFETEAANKTLQFLANVFKGSKEQLEAALKQVALKSERDKQRLTELKAQAELLKLFNEAFKAAINALVKCKSSGTVSDTAEAATAVDSANVNAFAAGRTPPFAVTPYLTDNETTNKSTCANVLQQVAGNSP